MKYLLDTNIFLFLISQQFKYLSKKQIEIIYNSDNELFISEASFFEIGIKARIGKESFSHIDISRIDKDRKASNIKFLKTKPEHYTNISKVPKVYISDSKLHGDPFDLLIISQAIIEQITVLSSDRLFPQYQGITTIS